MCCCSINQLTIIDLRNNRSTSEIVKLFSTHEKRGNYINKIKTKYKQQAKHLVFVCKDLYFES